MIRLLKLLFAISVTQLNQVWAQNEPFNISVADDAAWCWFSDPRAVVYQGKHDRVYFGYINSKGDVVLSSKERDSSRVESCILHEKLQVDDHNVPSILFLPDGKILTFYTEHNGKIFMRKSKKPEDITAWEEERILDFGAKNARICYSNPVMLAAEKNRIYLFYRQQNLIPGGSTFRDWWQCFSYSDDLGETWAEGKRIMDSGDVNNTVYMKVSSDNSRRIDILFTDGHPKIGAASIYHMYYEQGEFHQTNGDKFGSVECLPIPIDQVDKVYDVNEHHTKSWIWDIALDSKRRPIVAYTRYPSEMDHRYHYAHWDGTQWSDEELCKAGRYITVLRPGAELREGHYSGGIVLDHAHPDNVYLSRQINGRFELEHWKKGDGNWIVNAITKKSKHDNIRPFVVANNARKNPIIMWMNGTYYHYTDFKTKLIMK